MTCIVGVIQKGKCYIGGDAAGSETSSGSIAERSSPKAFRKNDYIFGYTTSFRLGDILECICPPPEVKPETVSLRQHLILKWISVLREKLKTEGWLEIDKNREKGGTFIIGYHGELCVVYDDLQVSQVIDSYCSVGIGFQYSLGALYALKDTRMKPRDRILVALNAAQQHNAYVREPFTIVES